MYLPKHQYIVKQLKDFTGIGGFKDSLGQIVDASLLTLIETSFGEVFDATGINLDKGDFRQAGKLIPILSSEQVELATEDPKKISFNKPQAQNLQIENGQIQRYFYSNKCTGELKELNKDQYNQKVNTTNTCEVVATAQWQVEGPAEDSKLNGYKLEGVATVNSRAIQELKAQIPQIDQILSNPVEFIQANTLNTTKLEQTKVNSFDIPSPGKRL